MRRLLDKELADALARRGLRSRPWAVELDDSAYAFLVDKGFSPALGARPLKRALERYLLAPIAAAIVEQSVPEGDQFLFATAADGERIEVHFVDPDAEPEPEEAPEEGEDGAPGLRALARSAAGDEGSVRLVLGELERILGAVAELQQRKGHALSVVSEPGFWDRTDRFEILREAEYLDRLDAATRTAERLGTRLGRSTRQNGRASAELVRLLANRLHVLDRAVAGLGRGAPMDVLLVLKAQGGTEAAAFAAVLVEMYSSWARSRGMSLVELAAPAGGHVLAVSGLGCGEILGAEAGVHVLERVDEEHEGSRILDRQQVRVDVQDRPAGPDEGEAALVRSALAAAGEDLVQPAVARRYRPGRAPLVRDGARGYRTGRLDRILAGDFDLY
jgi:ATP-dependent Clp protease ATP-binding subunit ClpC